MKKSLHESVSNIGSLCELLYSSAHSLVTEMWISNDRSTADTSNIRPIHLIAMPGCQTGKELNSQFPLHCN